MEVSDIMIMEYKDKKLIEYLLPGGKYRIDFGSGCGDMIMWYPQYEYLKRIYPECHFDLYCESGQEKIWGTVFDRDETSYDQVFHLNFPMSEGSDLRKAEKSGLEEIGFTSEQIAEIPELATIPLCPAPGGHVEPNLVGVHYHGTALPDSVGCPEPIAKQIWQEVKEAGYKPIETHMLHVYHNPANILFDFVDFHMRDTTATLSNLFGLIQRLEAFIGVASGPVVAAMSIMPERTMYLEKNHPLETYISDERVQSVNVMDYQSGSVCEWLGGLRK